MQREEGNPGRNNPGDDRDMIAQLEDGKGGANGRGKEDTGSREELLGLTSREKSADERWRPAGGGAFQVDSRSAPGRYGGGEAVEKIERSGVGG